MTDKKNNIVSFAENEIELANLTGTEIGNVILEFIDNLSKVTDGTSKTMIPILNSIQNLIEHKPITPITYKDFVGKQIDGGGKENYTLEVCERYPSIYKDEDGKYYNDLAIGFVIENRNDLGVIFMYQNGFSSKQEIQLPYIPDTKIVQLAENECGCIDFKDQYQMK